jgi:hypothetical protein
MKAVHYWAGVGVLSASIMGATLMAQDKAPAGGDKMPQMTEEQMKEWAAYAAHAKTGPNHALLKTRAGNWNHQSKMWHDPAMPQPEMSSGKTECTTILGDRFLKSKVTGEAMGMPFEGISIIGYDNGKKQFTGVWLDTMSTSIMHGEGKLAADGKTLEMTWEGFDPVKNEMCSMRSIDKFTDANTWASEFYGTKDGKEFKMMEIAYTRAR